MNFYRYNTFRLGVENFLDDMQDDESDDDMDDADAMSNGDFEKKADTAEDFSDIHELAEDLQTTSQVCV